MATLDSLRTRVQSAELEIKSLSGARDAELQAATKLQKQTQQRCEALGGELEDCRKELAEVEAENKELTALMVSLLDLIDTVTVERKVETVSSASPVITAPTPAPAKPKDKPENSSDDLAAEPKNVAPVKEATKKVPSGDNAKKKPASLVPPSVDAEHPEEFDIPSPDNLPKSLDYLRAFLSK